MAVDTSLPGALGPPDRCAPPEPSPRRTADGPGRALGRTGAVLALASAAVHLLLLDAASLDSLAMGAMALGCLPCAWHLWRSPTGSVWGLTAAVDAAMLAVHAQMLAGPHVHPTSLMWAGAALVVGQLALAGAASLRR